MRNIGEGIERLTEIADEMYVEYAATVAATCECLSDVVSIYDYHLEETSTYEVLVRMGSRMDNKDHTG